MANMGVGCVFDQSLRTRGRVWGGDASGMSELPSEGADEAAVTVNAFGMNKQYDLVIYRDDKATINAPKNGWIGLRSECAVVQLLVK